MLIEVFDNIIHKKLNYQLILIGDTPSEKLKNLIQQRKLESKVMIYPFISNDDIKITIDPQNTSFLPLMKKVLVLFFLKYE